MFSYSLTSDFLLITFGGHNNVQENNKLYATVCSSGTKTLFCTHHASCMEWRSWLFQRKTPSAPHSAQQAAVSCFPAWVIMAHYPAHVWFLLLAIIRLIHLQQKICSVVSQEKTAALGITSEKKKKKKIKTISCRCVYCFCWQLIKNSSLKQYVPNWQMWTVLNVEKCFPHESDLKHDCFWQQIFSDRFSNDLFMCVGSSAASKAKDPYRYTSLKRNSFVYKPHRATAEADTCSKIQILNAFI